MVSYIYIGFSGAEKETVILTEIEKFRIRQAIRDKEVADLCMFLCICMCIYLCMDTCVRIYVYIFMCIAYMYLSTCIYIYIYI
jgi:hypothetical protein